MLDRFGFDWSEKDGCENVGSGDTGFGDAWIAGKEQTFGGGLVLHWLILTLLAEDFETYSAAPKPSAPKHYKASRSITQARPRVFQDEGDDSRLPNAFELELSSFGPESTYVGHQDTPSQLLRDVDGGSDVTVSTGPIFAAEVELPEDSPHRAHDTTQKGRVKATGQLVGRLGNLLFLLGLLAHDAGTGFC